MKDFQFLVETLSRNKTIFQTLLSNRSIEEVRWKRQSEQWCLLEVSCHLLDEERYDFRDRIGHIFTQAETDPPTFNPLNWVKDHAYLDQNYDEVVSNFLSERSKSIDWLNDNSNQNWALSCNHPDFEQRTAKFYLVNWVAHDYLHLKQICRLNYDYLEDFSSTPLAYAGVWT